MIPLTAARSASCSRTAPSTDPATASIRTDGRPHRSCRIRSRSGLTTAIRRRSAAPRTSGRSARKLMGDIEFMDGRDQRLRGFDLSDGEGRLRQGRERRLHPAGVEVGRFQGSAVRHRLLEAGAAGDLGVPDSLQSECAAGSKSAGIDTEPLREWASRLLDDGSQVLVPRNLLEETFRQAKTPRTVRQKYLAKSETPDWKVGAVQELSVDDADGWDGAAAAKRMLDEAGFDGDSPDCAKARRGFLIMTRPIRCCAAATSCRLPTSSAASSRLSRAASARPRADSTRPMPRPTCSTKRRRSSTATTRSSHRSPRNPAGASARPTSNCCEGDGPSRVRDQVHQGRARQQRD
jgi:hypothetical protein